MHILDNKVRTLLFSFVCVFLIHVNVHSQNTVFNPQINLLVYNSWVITPKSDTNFRTEYYSFYDFGYGLNNSFSTKSPFYLEVGVNYKSYGYRCCKNNFNFEGYTVSKYTLLDASISPKYYFKKKFFFNILIKVNWILNYKSFQSSSDFLIPIDKSKMSKWNRKDMPKDRISTTFASTGISFGKEFYIKNKQFAIVSIFAESPLRSINKFSAEFAGGYFIPRNIGITFGYGLRDNKFYH